MPLHDSSRGFNSSVEIYLRRHDRPSGEVATDTTSRRRHSMPTSPSGWLLNSDIPENGAPAEPVRRHTSRRLLFAAGGALAAGLAVALGLGLLGAEPAARPDDATSPTTAAAPAVEPAPAEPIQPVQPAQPLPGRIRIEIDGLPAGARVSLGGRVVTLPLEVERTGKPAVLSIAAEGHVPLTRAVVLDRDLHLSLSMERLEPEGETRPDRPAAKPARRKRSGGKPDEVWADNPFGG
jgi:hypothetical protein